MSLTVSSGQRIPRRFAAKRFGSGEYTAAKGVLGEGVFERGARRAARPGWVGERRSDDTPRGADSMPTLGPAGFPRLRRFIPETSKPTKTVFSTTSKPMTIDRLILPELVEAIRQTSLQPRRLVAVRTEYE